MRPTRYNNSDLLLISSISTCFGHLYSHRQEIHLRSTAYSCPVVAVVMLESRVARCVHCVENVAWLSQGTWNAVGSTDDGHKDARNMLRYCWLPINHYLLHLICLSFTCRLILVCGRAVSFINYVFFRTVKASGHLIAGGDISVPHTVLT